MIRNDNILTEKKAAANSGFALWGLTCYVETFVQGSTFVRCMNSSANIPPQRKAANRYRQPYDDSANLKLLCKYQTTNTIYDR